MKIGILTSADLPELNVSDRSMKMILEKNGHQCTVLIWDQINWSKQKDLDFCIIRSTWDYYKKIDLFFEFVKACPVPLMNSAEIVLWNSNKKYLLDLEKVGVPIIPTKIISKIFEINEENLPWKKLVIKPSISASSFKTYLFEKSDLSSHRKDLEDILSHSELLIQPFMSEIKDHGEVSLIFFRVNKKPAFSHAVLKTAKPGEFRIQQEFGGSADPYQATLQELQTAEKILHKLPHAWVYARVDFIPTNNGPLLCELEMIEPELFMATSAQSAEKFYQAIIGAISTSH